MPALREMIVAASLAAATVTVAAPAHVTDVQYLEANRCRALIASTALGGGDTKAIDAFLRAQRGGRDAYISDKADQTQDETAREARRATGDRKTMLIAERDQTCLAFTTPSAVAGGSPNSGHSVN